MDEYKQKGFIRKLEDDEQQKQTDGGNVWYPPHFGVTNPNKPGKFRLVFDAAAKSHGICLNDALVKRPDLIRPLVSVLWNFRLHPVVLTGDIADMFHCVSVRKEDRPAQRFLWRDGDTAKKPDIYEMQVLIFGATSSPCSAIFAKNKNAAKYAKDYPEAYRAIVDDHYVDDCLTGGKTDKEVIKLRKDISLISEAGNFVTKKYTSNSKAVLESIPADLPADGFLSLDDKSLLPPERVLGLWWNPAKDCFLFQLTPHKVPKKILEGSRPTKRQMCSLVMSVYDPVGFVNHFKIKGIMLLQRTWASGIDWDDEIPSDILTPWKTWVDSLQKVKEVEIPRCYSYQLNVAELITLHVFVDASSEAFAAVAYLVVNGKDGSEVSLLGSKARVAPLKKLTIPRMELQAELLGARLAKAFGDELRINFGRRIFWSDSKTVLSWIRSESGKFKEFVANRLGKIQEITEAAEWRWIPTDHNVADIATRFDGKISFSPGNVWFAGPDFLRESGNNWPKERDSPDDGCINAIIDENIAPVTPLSDEDKIFLPVKRFSSYQRLLRTTAAVISFAEILKLKVKQRLGAKMDSGFLPIWSKGIDGAGKLIINKDVSRIPEEYLCRAERLLVKTVQQSVFKDVKLPLKKAN